jgi:hypothetical protein
VAAKILKLEINPKRAGREAPLHFAGARPVRGSTPYTAGFQYGCANPVRCTPRGTFRRCGVPVRPCGPSMSSWAFRGWVAQSYRTACRVVSHSIAALLPPRLERSYIHDSARNGSYHLSGCPCRCLSASCRLGMPSCVFFGCVGMSSLLVFKCTRIVYPKKLRRVNYLSATYLSSLRANVVIGMSDTR